uniref:SCP domain-containing protein n=1 Tax=Strongyloides papillosus TaxID=174720 RepID=A0A0N5BV74_STREA
MDFLEYISENHPELRHKQIVLIITGHFDQFGFFKSDNKPQVYKTCLPQPHQKRSSIIKKKTKFSKDGILVRYSIKGRPSYKCNGRTVPSLKHLAQCTLKQRQIKFGPTCSRGFYKDEAPVCVKDILPEEKSLDDIFCEKPNTIYMAEFQKSLKYNTFSSKTWFSIWENRLSFMCFSRDNFYLLKSRFLKELNIYRIAHNAPPLIENLKMTEKAQLRAKALANFKKISPDPNKEYEEVIGSSEIFMAPFMIKRWYDECNRYNFRLPILTRKSKNFVKLIWKNSMYIGIGVVKSQCHIIVVLKFTRRKSKFTGYLSNVQKRIIKNNF